MKDFITRVAICVSVIVVSRVIVKQLEKRDLV